MTTFPRATVQTPYGELEAWATSGEHVGFSEPSENGGTKVATMTFNRIPHYVRIDMHPDSYWLTPEGNAKGMTWGAHGWSTDWHYIVRRADRWTNDGATASVNRKVQTELIPLLAEWIVSDEGQALLAQAAKQKAQDNLEAAKHRVAKAQAELVAAETALAEMAKGGA